MRAVMYHYVREYRNDLPHFRYLDVANFRRQLDYFEQEFGFVTYDEWREFVSSGAMPRRPGSVVLTFDDAMSDHYEYVYPELRKRGLWAIFYVPTAPYAANVILDVHRIHLLCGAVEGRQLYEQAMKIVSPAMLSDEKREEFQKKTYTRQDNYEGVAEFKRLLNYFIDYEYRAEVINKIADSVSFRFDGVNFYVSADQLAEMSRNGMLIGSHTQSHPVMSKLPRPEQQEEISRSFDFLSTICGAPLKTYCHPYGGFHSFNDDTIAILRANAVDFSFNVECREIDAVDWESSIHFLPRFDCNQFPFGSVS